MSAAELPLPPDAGAGRELEPAESEFVEPLPIDPGLVAEQPRSPIGPPRVWTVFLAFLLLGGGGLAIQVLAAFAYVAVIYVQRGAGAPFPDLMEELFAPGVVILMTLPGQLVFGLGAVLAARLSATPLRQRLRLLPPRLSALGVVAAVLGSAVPAGVGWTVAELLSGIFPPDTSLEQTYRLMTPEWALPWIVFLAWAPGLCEELLFRGYVQTRLDERWSTLPSISVTAFLFAALHLMPYTIIFAFPIGLYFGIVTRRSGSIYPAILGHAFVNGAVGTYAVGSLFWGWPEAPPVVALVVLAIAGSAAFVFTMFQLQRLPDPATTDAPTSAD